MNAPICSPKKLPINCPTIGPNGPSIGVNSADIASPPITAPAPAPIATDAPSSLRRNAAPTPIATDRPPPANTFPPPRKSPPPLRAIFPPKALNLRILRIFLHLPNLCRAASFLGSRPLFICPCTNLRNLLASPNSFQGFKIRSAKNNPAIPPINFNAPITGFFSPNADIIKSTLFSTTLDNILNQPPITVKPTDIIFLFLGFDRKSRTNQVAANFNNFVNGDSNFCNQDHLPLSTFGLFFSTPSLTSLGSALSLASYSSSCFLTNCNLLASAASLAACAFASKVSVIILPISSTVLPILLKANVIDLIGSFPAPAVPPLSFTARKDLTLTFFTCGAIKSKYD